MKRAGTIEDTFSSRISLHPADSPPTSQWETRRALQFRSPAKHVHAQECGRKWVNSCDRKGCDCVPIGWKETRLLSKTLERIEINLWTPSPLQQLMPHHSLLHCHIQCNLAPQCPCTCAKHWLHATTKNSFSNEKPCGKNLYFCACDSWQEASTYKGVFF